MKLYDLYPLDGTFVDTLTRKEAVERSSLSGGDFKSKIDYREPINGEYYLDDSEDDITVRKHKDKDILAQFDLLTSKLRKILKAEEKRYLEQMIRMRFRSQYLTGIPSMLQLRR